MSDIYWFLLLLGVGYVFGTKAERDHFTELIKREEEIRHIPLLSTDEGYDSDDVAETSLVFGNVSLGPDYFRMVVASVINFFGGRISVYENLMDRARREAIVRMFSKASNPDLVINLRLETFVVDAGLGRKQRWIKSIDALAYGTAVKLKKKAV